MWADRLTRNYISCVGHWERSKTIPCPAANPGTGHIREYIPPPPPPLGPMIHVGKVKRERVILEKSDSMKKIITEKHKNSPFSHPFSSDPSGHSSIPLQRWLSRIKRPSRSHLINWPLLSWKAEIKRTTKLFNFEIIFLSDVFYIPMLLSRLGKIDQNATNKIFSLGCS